MDSEDSEDSEDSDEEEFGPFMHFLLNSMAFGKLKFTGCLKSNLVFFFDKATSIL